MTHTEALLTAVADLTPGQVGLLLGYLVGRAPEALADGVDYVLTHPDEVTP